MTLPVDERGDDRGPTAADRPRGGGRRAALRIVLIYAGVGAAWILFSDLLLEIFVPDPVARGELQSAKGAFYVAATAALLYLLMRRHRAGVAARDRQLRATLDSMVDAVVVVDRRTLIVDSNAAAAEIIGQRPSAGQPLGLAEFLRLTDLRHGDGRPLQLHESATFRALHGETVTGVETRLRDRRGHDVFMSVSAAPVYGDRGNEPIAAVVVMRDISEVKRFEGMREEFLATAAHELKTPLAVVKAYAQLMQRRGEGDPAGLAAINRQVDRLSRIVQQLLEVSRFRIGGGDLQRERFDLGDVAEEVAERMQAASGGRIAVARDAGATVDADRARIAQVVSALLENALRFSPGGGTVETSVTKNGDQAVLSVRDRGVGIPPERQDRIFERYYRAHAGTAEDYGGLGLGLDVSREIVARHGGRIWFQSEPGQGSTFWFSLPLAREAS